MKTPVSWGSESVQDGEQITCQGHDAPQLYRVTHPNLTGILHSGLSQASPRVSLHLAIGLYPLQYPLIDMSPIFVDFVNHSNKLMEPEQGIMGSSALQPIGL